MFRWSEKNFLYKCYFKHLQQYPEIKNTLNGLLYFAFRDNVHNFQKEGEYNVIGGKNVIIGF